LPLNLLFENWPVYFVPEGVVLVPVPW